MLTADDVRKIPLFSSVSAADLERLVRTSADIHLSAGEFAVAEGGERALYAVLLRQDRGRQADRRPRAHARLARPRDNFRRGSACPRGAVSGRLSRRGSV